MLLAINCNNTNIKFGVVDGDRIVGECRQHTSAMRTADEHAVWLFQLMAMEGIDPKSITDAIVASVVPNANFNLRRLCSRYFDCEPMFLGDPNVVYGIQVKGQGAGADRICNTVGASLLFPRTPVLVVDFGTSTNFDVVSAHGDFVGGALAPGIEISLDALAARAAQLRKVELVEPRSPIGKNTVEALQSGILYGFAAQVDGMVRRLSAELAPDAPGDVAVIATGGLAPLVIEHCETVTRYEPDLTLLGLRLVFDRNH